MALKGIKPTDAKLGKAKILIYGYAGAGKTLNSLAFPNAYYIDSEGHNKIKEYLQVLDASGGAYIGREQGSQDAEDVLQQIKDLATTEHPYKTLVLDSVTKLFNGLVTKEAERLGDKDVFGASKKPAINFMRRLINCIDKLDMNVILISQEKTNWVNDKQVGVTFDAWDKLAYEVNLCLHIVRPGANPPVAFVKKSRFNTFPQESTFPWSYNEFSQRYGEELLTGEVKKVNLITKELLVELEALIKLLNIESDRIEKWLDYDRADSLEELSLEYAEKLIAKIKESLPK